MKFFLNFTEKTVSKIWLKAYWDDEWLILIIGIWNFSLFYAENAEMVRRMGKL